MRKHVAQMIDSGASLNNVDRLHQMRFGKKYQIGILPIEGEL